MRLVEERLEVIDRPVLRIDRLVRRDVVSIIAQRRGIERQQPDRRHAERLDVVELVHQTLEVTVAVRVAVAERLDVSLINDRVLVPERVVIHRIASWTCKAETGDATAGGTAGALVTEKTKSAAASNTRRQSARL